MTVKIYPEILQVVESADKNLIAISIENNVAGSSDITFFTYKPLDESFLRGTDFPTLVRAWDNKDDDIFDNL